jgi:competence protein ComEC
MSWHRTPFIRILFPFLMGLLLAYYFPSKPIAYLGLFVIGLGITILLPWARQKKISPTSVQIWAIVASFLLVALGYSRSFWEDAREWGNHVEHTLTEAHQTYLARVCSEVKLKNSSVQMHIQLLQRRDSLAAWQAVEGKILASIELDSLSAQLTYGQGLLFKGELSPIEGAVNPHAFDAQRYYKHKNIHHRIYLKSGYWEQMDELNGGNLLTKTLLSWRSYLLNLFQQQLGPASNEYAVAAALILGDRSSISSDLRNAYADTGATHVLAVSGLHVGLVVMLLSLLLNIGKRKSRKHWGQTILLLLGIWTFALLTGASPSVLRASTMFSFLTIGDALGRRSSIYNTLAASAFFMLCLQPFALWDLGFQLSYLAVIGIVYLQPKIYKWLYVPNKIGDYIWNLTSVSLAAQLATLPISLLYFHQFPLYFWLSGLIVIPLATIILVVGIATLLFSFIPLLANFLGYLLYGVIFMMNAAIFSIQQLPFAKLESFWLENWEALLCYALIISFIIGFQYKKRGWNLAALACLLLLSFSGLMKHWERLGQEKIYVYKVYKGSTLDFIKGKKAVTIADTLHSTPKELQWTNQNNLWAHGIKQAEVYKLHQDSIRNDFLWVNQMGYGQFGEERFAILPRALASRPLAANEPLQVDWLLLQGNPYLKDLSELEELIDYRYLVFDASNSPWRLAQWRQQSEAEGIPYVDCSKEGKELPR